MITDVNCKHDLNFGFEGTYTYQKPHFLSLDYFTVVNIDSKLDKIGFNGITYDCGNIYEITTKKGKFKINDIDIFLEHKKTCDDILSKYMLVASSETKNIIDEGGGHIHLSLSEVNKRGIKFKKLFMQNMYSFFILNPWLNWMFNGPYDNINANSMLTERHIAAKNNNIETYSEIYDSWYHILNYDILTDNLNKTLPVIYRKNYQTVEFRIFMMPRNEEETRLHFNLAKCIYNYIYNKTCANERIKHDLSIQKINNIEKYANKNINDIFIDYEDVFETIPFSHTLRKLKEVFYLIDFPSDNIELAFKIKKDFLKIRYKYKGLLK